MLRLFSSEEFREIEFEDKPTLRYAISNYGRLVSYTEDYREGRLIKPSNNNGTPEFKYKVRKDGKILNKAFAIAVLVAKYFIPKTSEEQRHVIRIDHDADNHHVSNLKWATPAEKAAHLKLSPKVIAAKKKLLEMRIKADGRKLTVTQVMRLKKLLLDPNRKTRMKILAKQFNISEMQLYRIKSGENWGHIKV